MKKKVTIVVVIVLVIVLIAACVMWRIGGVETESALGDHQKYVYAYVSSIEGNEVTYMEVDESVAKAAEERAKEKEKAEAEDDAGSDSTGQGDKSDGGTDSAGQSDKNDGGTGSAGQSDKNDDGTDSTGQSDKSGSTGSDGDKSGMGTPPGIAGSSGGGQTPPDMDSTEMPQGAPGGMSDMTGETVTTMIPVGVTVHTTSDTTTTFSRLATGDLLKILVETDSDGNEVIEEIWMLQ